MSDTVGMETRQPATSDSRDIHAQTADDLAVHDRLIAQLVERMETAPASELKDLAAAIGRLQYTRRVLVKYQGKTEPEEQDQPQPAELPGRRARGKALAAQLSAA